jgi:GT2 family glycosyltransferase
MMQKLAVVIVNWNTEELTRGCLKSLFSEIDGIDSEVWVVDNNSSDGSVAMIKSEFPKVKLIANKDNSGFAKANNQALELASADYYMLLNPDTIVPPNSIIDMLRFMDENNDAAAIGPKLMDGESNIQIPLDSLPSFGGEILNCLKYHFFPFKSIFANMGVEKSREIINSLKPVRKNILSAACLMIRDEVIKKIGVLGEDYFLFSEEDDYFTRMNRAGFISYYLPYITIIHLVGKSREGIALESTIQFFKSRILYFRKFAREKVLFIKIIYIFFFLWSYLLAVVSKMLKGNKGSSDYQVLYSRLLSTVINT